MKKLELTKSDQETIKHLPEGWFEPGDLRHVLTRRDYRCERLLARGALEHRLVGEYLSSSWRYRKLVNNEEKHD